MHVAGCVGWGGWGPGRGHAGGWRTRLVNAAHTRGSTVCTRLCVVNCVHTLVWSTVCTRLWLAYVNGAQFRCILPAVVTRTRGMRLHLVGIAASGRCHCLCRSRDTDRPVVWCQPSQSHRLSSMRSESSTSSQTARYRPQPQPSANPINPTPKSPIACRPIACR